MNVRDILTTWLLKNGYDGLWNEVCGCETDNLVMCSEDPSNCEPGYKTECDCGDECIFHISPKTTVPRITEIKDNLTQRVIVRGYGSTREVVEANQNKLRRAFLPNVDLEGANLAGASLNWANLAGASLKETNLEGARLNRVDLKGANLAGANLTKANLAGANLTKANLAGASLKETNLEDASLAGANLKGANFDGASFYKTNFEETCLE